MIDLHAHLLPSVDDGSGSIDESLALLGMLTAQGVEKVFATPHFYADKDTPSDFFERRARAYAELLSARTENLANVFLGAEVAYFQGISRMKELADMRLGGTKLLLLEMPPERWSDYTVRELIELSCSGEIRPMIAHVERCMGYQSSRAWRSLLESGIVMQTNASFFIRPKTARLALKLLKRGTVHVIASDCHNVRVRPPRMREAMDRIEARLGEDAMHSMRAFLKEITA